VLLRALATLRETQKRKMAMAKITHTTKAVARLSEMAESAWFMVVGVLHFLPQILCFCKDK
jgi:hypothetical protein